jgi:hypothetical protein
LVKTHNNGRAAGDTNNGINHVSRSSVKGPYAFYAFVGVVR